jgi:hypothetical protein
MNFITILKNIDLIWRVKSIIIIIIIYAKKMVISRLWVRLCSQT